MHRLIGCSLLIKVIALAGLIWSSICLSRLLELQEAGKKLAHIKMRLEHARDEGEDLLDYAFGGSGETGSEMDMKLSYVATNVAFYATILIICCVCLGLSAQKAGWFKH